MCEEEGGAQVNRVNQVPLLYGHVGPFPVRCHRGAVHETVELSRPLGGAPRQCLNRTWLCEVGADVVRHLILQKEVNLRCKVSQRLESVEDNPCAFLKQKLRRG